MPTVSIVVPAYNVEPYLDACLASILAQTYDDIEVLVVDDGSSDLTASIASQVAAVDARVHVVRKRNGGVSSARNSGIDASIGEWILFVDADDLLPPDALESLVTAARQHDADCVIGQYGTVGQLAAAPRMPGQIRAYSSTEAQTQLLYQNIANAPFAKLYRRETIDGVRFPVGVAVAEDLNFNYYALARCARSIAIDDVVYLYRVRAGSAMTATSAQRRMASLEITAQIEAQANSPSICTQLASAARCRHFMEAIYTGILMNAREHESMRRECVVVIKQFRLRVLADKRAPRRYRGLATVAALSARLALSVFASRSRSRIARDQE